MTLSVDFMIMDAFYNERSCSSRLECKAAQMHLNFLLALVKCLLAQHTKQLAGGGLGLGVGGNQNQNQKMVNNELTLARHVTPNKCNRLVYKYATVSQVV